MEGLAASPGISAISASTEQRILLGNIVDEGGGGGVDKNAPSHQQWRSPMRVRIYL